MKFQNTIVIFLRSLILGSACYALKKPHRTSCHNVLWLHRGSLSPLLPSIAWVPISSSNIVATHNDDASVFGYLQKCWPCMSHFERTLKTSQWLPVHMAPTGSCFDTEMLPVQNGTPICTSWWIYRYIPSSKWHLPEAIVCSQKRTMKNIYKFIFYLCHGT